MKILVTGSEGQLGNEIRLLSSESGDTFVFSDINDRSGNPLMKLDLTDRAAVLDFIKGEGFDVIINCAAYTDVEKAEDCPDLAALINRDAPAFLAEAAASCGAVLIHISTDYVFGGDACTPYGESDPKSPLGVYGRTKLQGEEAVAASGCRYIILRTAWLYSPFGKNFVKTMRMLTSSKPQIKVVYDQVGSPTYARDLAGAICKIIEVRMLDRQGIYHYTDEGVCSWYDFACAIRDFSGYTCDIVPCTSEEFPTKASRPHYSVLSKASFKDTFGIHIPHWPESLKDCIMRLDETE